MSTKLRSTSCVPLDKTIFFRPGNVRSHG